MQILPNVVELYVLQPGEENSLQFTVGVGLVELPVVPPFPVVPLLPVEPRTARNVQPAFQVTVGLTPHRSSAPVPLDV